jgi:hypothetical protein
MAHLARLSSLENDCARFRGHSRFGFDSASAVFRPRSPSFKAYFFLAAFFLAFFFAFAMLALQLSG